ncbi:stromal interaction molecule homolog, partial [Caerostris extrusa]
MLKSLLAEQQLQAAKEGCEKLSKKRATFMGAFRIAHGSSIDDVDDRIVKAKSALFEVTNDLQERMNRWKQIELLCGVPIILNPGLTCLENILKPSKGNGTVNSTHSGLNAMSLSSSDSTLREESPPPRRELSKAPPPTFPPPSYSKSSPLVHQESFHRGSHHVATTTASPVTAVSRVVYPNECYRPLADNVSSFETDNEDLSIVEDDSTERSVTRLPWPPVPRRSGRSSPWM